MKTRTLLIAALMFLGLTAAAFAQATYSVGSIPVTTVIKTGLTEKTGDVTFTQISGTSLTGTITINYNVPVTVDKSAITVTGSGAYAGVAGLGVNSLSSSSGILVINVPSGVSGAGSFTVSGVRVAIAGTGLTNLTATISTTNNAIVAGQTSVVVITSVGDGIASINSSSSSAPTVVGKVNGLTGAVGSQPVIAVREGFLNAFNDINPKTGFGTGLKFTLSAAPPSGVTISFPASFTTNGAGSPTFVAFNSDASGPDTDGFTFTSSAPGDLTAYYKLTSTSDPTKQEYAAVPVTLTVDTGKTPYAPFTENVSVSLWPNGTAFKSNGDPITDNNLIPRYQELFVGPTTLFQIISSTTTLLAPFAQTVTALGYNTAFAIANTTKDPGSSATGITAATAQTGTITFYFFSQLPRGGTTLPATITYTTAAGSPGTGLDANGRLPAGSTYNLLLSELLAAAGAPADFVGYVFIVTNFTNAHAFVTIANFGVGGYSYSQGYLALVVGTTANGDRNQTPEGLNQ